MTQQRWNWLMSFEGQNESLTEAEIKEGHHFCNEFDGLLRNSNEEEFKCTCNEYQSISKEPSQTSKSSPPAVSDNS